MGGRGVVGFWISNRRILVQTGWFLYSSPKAGLNAVPTVKITLGTLFPGVPAGNYPCLDVPAGKKRCLNVVDNDDAAAAAAAAAAAGVQMRLTLYDKYSWRSHPTSTSRTSTIYCVRLNRC